MSIVWREDNCVVVTCGKYRMAETVEFGYHHAEGEFRV